MNHILIVDDDPNICRSMQRVLVSEGFTVTTARNGPDAIRKLGEHTFDVAVVDYDMPGVDGLKVLSHIREEQPGCIRMLMTGSTDFPMIVAAVNRGEVLRVVEKPFEPRGFLKHLGDAYASVRRMADVRQAQKVAVEASERLRGLLAPMTTGSASLPAMAAALEAAGVKTSTGKSTWAPMQVKRALTRLGLR